MIARAGIAAVERGLERFFARHEGGRESAGPGDLPELLAAIGAEAGADLGTLQRDGFEDGALPELAFVDVRTERRGEAFTVTGKVTNSGTGEAHCPVTLTTASGSVGTRVVVPQGASVPFAITSSAAPQTLLLDPDATCLRWQPDPPGALLQRINLDATADGAR